MASTSRRCALIKLDGVLPSRLRQRVSSLSEAISTIPTSGPVVDPAVLATVAGAIRDRELLRFDYRRHDQTSTGREAEPHRLVHASRRWYLVGWDIGQQEWRTFRVDRMRVKVPNGRRFTPRPPPIGGFERHITEGLSVQTWPLVGRFLLHAPLEQVWDRSHLTEGALTAVDDRHCLLTVGADSEAFLLVIVGIYDVNFTVLGPPSLRERAATLARRYQQASEASEVTKDGDPC